MSVDVLGCYNKKNHIHQFVAEAYMVEPLMFLES